jgi:hypothetical protein
MLHLRHHVVVDDRRLDVVDHQLVHLHLVYLIYTVMKMVRHQCVVENLRQLMGRRFAVHLDVLQILDEQNLDVVQTFQVVAVHHLDVAVLRLVVVVDVVLCHQLKTDCCLDEELQELELQELKFQRHRLHGQPLALPPHALQFLLC